MCKAGQEGRRRDMWAAPKKRIAVDHCLMVLSRQREAGKPSNKKRNMLSQSGELQQAGGRLHEE